MSGRKFWYLLTLLAFTMLPLAGCGGTSGTTAVSKDGYKLTASGHVAGGKTTLKTLFAAAPDLGTLTVLNAQDGTTVGTGVIDSAGKFSNLVITLPAAKSVLVFRADVSLAGTPFRTILPIDLSNPPAVGISANNSINIEISQNSTNIATAVSAMLGVTGLLGDTGATLTSVNKTYSDVAQQVVNNGGKVYAYTTNGPEIIGSLPSASLLPAKDASTLSYYDLNNVKFDAKIVSAFVPGKNPIVNFQVTDKATGKGISGLKTFGLHIAKLVPATNGSSSYWVNYLDRGISLPAPLAFATTSAGKQVTGTIGKPVADPGKTLVASNAVGIDFTSKPVGSVLIPGYTVIDKGDGSYTAIFYSDVTSNANAPFDASATHRIGVTVTTVAAPGVSATFPIDPATGLPSASIAANNRQAVVYDFVPATGAMLTDANGTQIFARNLVPTAACNGCHTNIASIMGHTARPNLLLCDICHVSSNTSGEGEMVTMIHRIHMGKNLPVPVVAENVANPTKLAPRTAVLVPYDTFIFPQDMRNCTVCHQGADAAAWMSNPTIKNCGSCHNATDFLTHKGSQTNDLACVGCHQEATGSLKPVSVAHATDYATPNNPQTPAGLVNFKYDLKSVTVDATTNQAAITFRILSDGGTGAAMAPVAFTGLGSTASPLLTGFTGSPGFILAYNKSAANQAFTTSADYNNLGVKAAQPISVSIANLADATKGTLSAPDASGYYTATITATASNFPAGSKMRTVALQGYFTQVSPASGRHTISVVKTVTGDTARRVVIDSGKCGACHEIFEGHGGNRNIGKETVGEAVCTLCHVPNLSTSGKGTNSASASFPANMTAAEQALLTADGYTLLDPTTYPEETNNFKDMIHGIHAGSSRTAPLKFVRDRGSVVLYFSAATFKFPAILKNCEACHTTSSYKAIPANAQVTTDLTSDGTVLDLTNNVTAVAAARTSLPNAQDLVTTPFTAACVSCHDLPTSKGHMKQNGGQIKVLRSVADPANETCVTCHGVTGTASIYTSHRF